MSMSFAEKASNPDRVAELLSMINQGVTNIAFRQELNESLARLIADHDDQILKLKGETVRLRSQMPQSQDSLDAVRSAYTQSLSTPSAGFMADDTQSV